MIYLLDSALLAQRDVFSHLGYCYSDLKANAVGCYQIVLGHPGEGGIRTFACFFLVLSLSSVGASAGPRDWAETLAEDVLLSMRDQLSQNQKSVRLRWIEQSPYFQFMTRPRNVEGEFAIDISRVATEETKMTPGVFALLLCHELGHVLGGAPFAIVDGDPVSNLLTPVQVTNLRSLSAEGQADFYATSVCLKKVLLRRPDLKDGLSTVGLPPRIAAHCAETFASDSASASLCGISARISAQTIHLFASLSNGLEQQVSYEQGTGGLASHGTLRTYPSLQCRFSTLVFGGLCSNDADPYVCLNSQGNQVELRPGCWLGKESP